MKILLVHNFYQSSSPSGEDVVFRNECELLKRNGIDVVTYERHNDEIKDYGLRDKLLLPFRNIWSKRTYEEIKELINREKPDLAHFHNIWYLITTSAYYACKDAGVPVIQTLHNFRMFCANGLLLRDGKVCEECIGHLPWRGAKYGCYGKSRLYSLPITLTQGIHSIAGTWRDKIDAFVALTEFSKKKFVECGLPEDKIFVKPNFLPDPPDPNYRGDGYAVFLGRLSSEKGLNVLINAYSMLRLKSSSQAGLKIIGDGPLRENLENILRAGKAEDVELTGKKKFGECMEILGHAGFLVLPTLCYEGFPMVIREAYACGKPVVASGLGAMAELIQDGKTGFLFEPGNPADLAAKMERMLENKETCIEMGKNARKEFEEKYTAEKNFEILMRMYRKLMAHS